LVGVNVEANKDSGVAIAVFILLSIALNSVVKIASLGFENGYWKDRLTKP
jgi:hypothetical protein